LEGIAGYPVTYEAQVLRPDGRVETVYGSTQVTSLANAKKEIKQKITITGGGGEVIGGKGEIHGSVTYTIEF
jgi:hypothetical protein